MYTMCILPQQEKDSMWENLTKTKQTEKQNKTENQTQCSLRHLPYKKYEHSVLLPRDSELPLPSSLPPAPPPQVLWVLMGIWDDKVSSAVGTDIALPTVRTRDRQDPCSQLWRQWLNF